MADAFFDTNTLLYAIGGQPDKAERSRSLLRSGGTISVQVLNEFTTVAVRKQALSLPEVAQALEPIRITCRVEPLTVRTYDRAVSLAKRYNYALYDCTIIAAALLANCDLLYSEDMQHGQIIEDALTIHNPFV